MLARCIFESYQNGYKYIMTDINPTPGSLTGDEIVINSKIEYINIFRLI
jgi:hypothetical protein